jgi:hypothetical protein
MTPAGYLTAHSQVLAAAGELHVGPRRFHAYSDADRINCYDWITATRRKGHAMMSTIAVIGPGVSGSARAFELADAGTHGVPVRHARLLSC